MLNNLMLKLMVITTSLNSTGMLGGSEAEERAEQIVKNIVTPVGNAVISVIGAIGIIFVAIGLIKSGIILADADKAGPEQTAKAKTVVKNNVIALIIIIAVMVGFLASLNTWLQPLLKNMIANI